VKSQATRRFWKLYQELPADVQRLASKIINFGARILRTPLSASAGFKATITSSLCESAIIIERWAKLNRTQ